jgi:plasmid stabilization system protein ParE
VRVVRWHPSARAELLDAAAYYKQQRAGLDHLFLSAVDRIVGLIQRFPLLGHVVHPGYRRFVVHRFPYSVIYRIQPKELEIVGIVNQYLDSDSWKGR